MSYSLFHDQSVADVFAAYSPPTRERLLALRALIFEVAGEIAGIGEIEETLKWGQPSYLPSATKSGTPVRISQDTTHGGDYALYVHCQTNVADEWKSQYPELNYGGNRSIHFSADEEIPRNAIKHCVALALTYHARNKG
jgi:hypothetical protein